MKRLFILGALLKKEFTLMRRTRFIPPILVMMPLMVMLVIPLVANMDISNVKVAVVDRDHTQLSRRVVADMQASGFISIVAMEDDYDRALENIERGEADVVMTIPNGFSEEKSQIDMAANGVNAVTGVLGAQYASQSVARSLLEYYRSQGMEMKPQEVSIRNDFNPTLTYRNYMLPALVAVLLIIICGFLPALNLVSEKESGTLEAMNVTPVSRFSFVLSKLVPYWLAGMLVVTIGLLVSRYVYGLVPEGTIVSIYLAAALFTIVMSGLGVFIANKSDTMLQSIFVMFAIIMIFQLMGGLFTPISSMPQWAQYITYAVPPRYFNEIMRAVYLKGSGVNELAEQYIALAAFAVGFSTLAALSYKKVS